MQNAKSLKADAWIPLDASFKQYDYSEGIDMQTITDIDINATAENLIASREINTTQGYT